MCLPDCEEEDLVELTEDILEKMPIGQVVITPEVTHKNRDSFFDFAHVGKSPVSIEVPVHHKANAKFNSFESVNINGTFTSYQVFIVDTKTNESEAIKVRCF